MELRFDWPKIYASVVQVPASEKRAPSIARLIERDIRQRFAVAGTLFGTVPEICERFDVGRETLLQAVCLLEDRGVARMRRGPRGGLMVLREPSGDPTLPLVQHLRMREVSRQQIDEALAVIALLHDYERHARFERTDAFDVRYQALLDAGASPAAGAGAVDLPPTSCLNRTLRPFAEALELLGRQDSAEPCAVAAGRLTLGLSTHTRGLVSLVAEAIAGELANGLRRPGEKLGNEIDLADRMGVSRQVLRQALRLLEGRGLLACQRGRGRGIVGTGDHAPAIIEVLVDHYDAEQLHEAEFRPLLTMLDRVNRALVASKVSPDDFAAIERVMTNRRWNDPSSYLDRMHMEWALLDNPALSLLEQALSAYRTRRAGTGVFMTVGDTEGLQHSMHEHLAALKSRNLAGADRLNAVMQRQITVMLGVH
jgi:DNA-binding FadR family transcriptional regulator